MITECFRICEKLGGQELEHQSENLGIDGLCATPE